MADHFIYKKESTFGTWVTPDLAIPVKGAGIHSRRSAIDLQVTGGGRDPFQMVMGKKAVGGGIEFPWWTTRVGPLLSTILTSVTTTNPSGSIYNHAMLFDDTALLGSVSAQMRYSASVAQNILSAVISKISFTWDAGADEPVLVKPEFEAKDEAPAGGTWDYDGATSSPAVISPSYASQVRPFMFYDCVIKHGGTPSISGGKISLAGATTVTRVKNISLDIDMGVDADGFRLAQDPTRKAVPPGERKMSVKISQDWSTLDSTFYTAWRAGTMLALDITMQGAVISGSDKYEAHITVPSLWFDPATYPDVAGEEQVKMQEISGTPVYNTTCAAALGIWIQTSEATI
jgi:hypothetical protein